MLGWLNSRINSGVREFIKSSFAVTYEQCRQAVLGLLEKNESARVMDLGCEMGSFTKRVGQQIGTTLLYSMDRSEECILKAESKGVKTICCDLNKPFPIDDETFDVVIANQVIEHIYETDGFVREIRRILSGGGTL